MPMTPTAERRADDPPAVCAAASGNAVVLSVVQMFPPSPIGAPSKKRGGGGSRASDHALGGPDADTTSDDGGSGGDAGQSAQQKGSSRTAKKRKPSHIMIREEKELLRAEVERLEARAALLRRQAGLPDTREIAATREIAQENEVLADAVRRHACVVAGAHLALSEFALWRTSNPLEGFVRLSKEAAARSAEVMALRGSKLEQAGRFLAERERLSDALATGRVLDESGVVTPDGDYVLTKLATTCFRGVEGVEQAFDAMKFYFFNLEIANSELSGNISVREDNGLSGVDSSHSSGAVVAHRLVTRLPSGVLLEKNALKFMELYPGARPDETYALMAAVPINQDDLYPYLSAERLRMDMTVTMKLSVRYEDDPAGSASAQRLVVLFTRWFRVQLHRNDALGVPDAVLQDIRRSLSEPLDNVVKSMNQTLYGAGAV